ncbi:DEAD/DEAH box helicase, partial [bacterium]|nr:DEAD/DEAH box helicase [bacterium]
MGAHDVNGDLALTPAGHLLFRTPETDGAERPDPWMKRAAGAFSRSQAAGLFALAATRPKASPPPSLAFWRDFACRYLAELCRTPESAGDRLGPIEPPSEAELAGLLLSAPPMVGGEYLSLDVLRELWSDLDGWVRQEVDAASDGLGAWVKKHASAWHQVGRVCFHLAENKLDPEFPFAFLATYAPRLSKTGSVQYRPLGAALRESADAGDKRALVTLLSPVHRASETVDFVRELVESGDLFHPLAWTPAEAYRLLQSVPLLEESGLLVRLPDWWRTRARARVAVTIGEKKRNQFGADAMMDFKVGLALGDENLTQEEWRQIMESDDGLAYVRGQWIEVDREKLSEALEHWKRVEEYAGEDGISFIEGMRMLAGAPADLDAGGAGADEGREWSFVNAGDWLSSVLAGLRDPDGLAPGKPSENFHGTLRDYQETGSRWLGFLAQLGLGACLADDMGLGKTIQVISLLLSLKEAASETTPRPSLLVLPASLLGNWKAEIERFAPTLATRFIHPSETDRAKLAAMADDPNAALAGADAVLTTYGMLLRQKWLLDVKWRLVVLDEAQAIKNPATRQTRTVKKLQADARIALTGTPVENRLSDLWSLFDFLCPGLLGSAARFKRFTKGLEESDHDRYAPLRRLVLPYVLRRLKTDRNIAADLPDKTEVKAFCGLTKRQAALYARSVKELAQALETLDGMKRRGLVLATLMRLKQICNHPSQCLGDG